MAPLLLFIIGLLAVFLSYKWINKQPPNKRWQWLVLLVGIVLLVLVATGRMHWLFALIGAMIPALQRLIGLAMYVPSLRRAFRTFGSNKPSTGNTSEVETTYLKMQLDHDTGNLNGIVKTGTFSGQTLESLSLAQLQSLYVEYCQLDEDSKLLLQNYIDRTHGTDWHAEDEPSGHTEEGISSALSVEEAYAILGLDEGADKDAIISAHKSLMQKLHPDRGGSSYLATKINQAKDLLLKKFT